MPFLKKIGEGSPDDYFEIKRLVKRIGSNRRVMDKEVLLELVPPFDLVSKYPVLRQKQKSLTANNVCRRALSFICL